MEYDAASGQTGATNIVKLPLAFVRSGYVRLNGGYLEDTGMADNVGSFSYVWSRTSGSSTRAYYLYTDRTYVNPSSSNARYYGFPLRCLYPDNDQCRKEGICQ